MGDLVATLRGPAADIFNVFPEGVLTNANICNALNHRFGMDAKCDLVWAQLQQCRLKPGEMLQELAQDIYQSMMIAYTE